LSSKDLSVKELIVRQISASRAALVLIAVMAGSSFSTAIAADEKTLKEAESQLRDYVHYVKIARYDLANSFGQAVVDKLAKPIGKAEGDAAVSLGEFVKMLENGGEIARFEDAVGRGERVAEIEKVSSALANAYSKGKLEIARNASEITKSIGLLTGTQRQRLVSRERLAAAGEYAMPQLLSAFQKRDNPALIAEVRQLMVDMGRQAARPLQAAVSGLDTGTQEAAVGVLGDIPYTSSVAVLNDLANNSKSEPVRKAAARAMAKLGASSNANVAGEYLKLAEAYYSGAESLTPFPKDDQQLVWNYDAQTGLVASPVNSAVFHETMAMRTAESALRADAKNQQAVALWLAADFSREINAPKDYVNPLYKDRPEAMFYAAAAGTDALQAVLARALDNKDAQLARKAIAALGRTAGPAALKAAKGRNALVEALRFPNRRVQTDAALVLAGASSNQTFDGAERVVPVLASAVREAGAKYALVIAADGEKSKMIGDGLRAMGYTVLPPAAKAGDVENAVSSVAGVDLVVTSLNPKETASAVTTVRAHSKLSASPVLVMTDLDGVNELGGKYDRDAMVRIARTGISAEQAAEAVKQITASTIGEALTAEEASDYQNRALDAIKTVAVSGSTAYAVNDATAPLAAAMGDAKGGLKLKIADVLSMIGDKRAQQAVVDAALAADGAEMVSLVNSATASAKRFGNMLDERQVKRLLEAAGKTTAGEAGTALSALLGALNLQSDRVVPLILAK
jgi:HEAT repeat protein